MIFYCPQCGKTDLEYNHDKTKFSFGNMRDGYGRPIHHTKCECGNCLAAYISFTKEDVEKDIGMMNYVKELIAGYNRDGIYYTDGFYEHVESRIGEYEKKQEENQLERERISKMTDLEKEEYFKDLRKEIESRFMSE